jgi:glycosyltransferase involved in cell wall biosynthesis
MLEAMAAGCLIVGSRTQPVEEVIRDCGNGLLIDFFSPQEVADRVIEALEDRRGHESIRKNARQTIVDEYDLRTICLPAHLRLLQTVALQSRSSRERAGLPHVVGQTEAAALQRCLHDGGDRTLTC